MAAYSLFDIAFAQSEERRGKQKFTQKRKGAVAWCRVSRSEQLAGSSIDVQRDDIVKWARKHDLPVLHVFTDDVSGFHGVSGSDKYETMLQCARSDQRVDTILVWSTDRFGRGGRDTQRLVEDLAKEGIEVLSVTSSTPISPQADDSAADDLMRAIEFFRGKMFSEAVSAHVKKSCRGNVATRDPGTGLCYKNGARCLWGYRTRRVTVPGRVLHRAVWELDDSVACGKKVCLWVREVLLEHAGKGQGVKQIARWLTSQGVPTPTGRDRWNHNTIYRMLQPWVLLKYSGTEVYGVTKKHSHIIQPVDKWTVVENAHPHIITEAECEQAMLARRRYKGK